MPGLHGTPREPCCDQRFSTLAVNQALLGAAEMDGDPAGIPGEEPGTRVSGASDVSAWRARGRHSGVSPRLDQALPSSLSHWPLSGPSADMERPLRSTHTTRY